MVFLIAGILLCLTLCIGCVVPMILGIRALCKYLNDSAARARVQPAVETLGASIKAHRMRCNMTQAFVADALGVSRQAVSKWESGACDPSTANRIALANLFKIAPQALLRGI
jgi:DNA-binding XRE family transcriptional regulator